MWLKVVINLLTILYQTAESIFWSLVPLKYKSKDISGQIVLVTGAGGGIGRLLALGLSALGCKVVCWDVVKEANDETARLISLSNKGEAFAYQVDLTKREEIYRAAERVKTEVGKVDILINNAGVMTSRSLLDCTDEQIQRTFDVNILAHFWTVKSFLPDMIMRDSGHIVTMASVGGLLGNNDVMDYCASKFAAVGFDESLRTELYVNGRKGIKTTVVCPYIVNTPLVQGIKPKLYPILEPEVVAQEIINSILANEHVCIIPRYHKISAILKYIIPTNVQLALIKMLGLGDIAKSLQSTKTKSL